MSDLTNYLNSYYGDSASGERVTNSSRRSFFTTLGGVLTGLTAGSLFPAREANALMIFGGGEPDPCNARILSLVDSQMVSVPSEAIYVVKEGDSPIGLAERFYGDGKLHPKIYGQNGKPATNLHPGMRVILNYLLVEKNTRAQFDELVFPKSMFSRSVD